MLGAPSLLTLELKQQIRLHVLDNIPYKEIQQILDISPGTWSNWVWDNYQGFRDDLNNWKKERMIRKASIKIETLVDSEDERVALDASKFLASTLGKEEYSTRTEQTGKDGAPLTVQVVQYANTPNPTQV